MEKKSLGSLQEYQEGKFTKRIAFQKGESVVFVLNFTPGQELPTHKHPGTDVYLLALEGNGTVTVDGTDSEFAKGEILHIHGDEAFSYANSGNQPASLYVVLSKVPDPRYAENI